MREYLESLDSYALPLFALSITSGARPSEICGLTWADCDLDAGVVLIRRGSHRIKGEIVESSLKTDRSRRAITLDAGTIALLMPVREKAEKLAELAEVPFNAKSPVFTPDGVHPYSPKWISKLWRKVRGEVCVTCGQAKRVPDDRTHKQAFGHDFKALENRLYDLRHSSASILLDLGVPVTEVSARLGHSSPRVTWDVYSHRLQSRQTEVADRLGQALNGSNAPALAPASD